MSRPPSKRARFDDPSTAQSSSPSQNRTVFLVKQIRFPCSLTPIHWVLSHCRAEDQVSSSPSGFCDECGFCVFRKIAASSLGNISCP